MRLADLLAALSDGDLARLAQKHVRTDEQLPRPAMLNVIEGVLRSYRFVQEFVSDRQPPAFSILTLLLDAPGHQLALDTMGPAALEESRRIADLVARGEIVGRDDQLRLYRRILCEARRNDLVLDACETAILGVLRRELGISQVEHFLIEHHPELQEFWSGDDAFTRELGALRGAGLVFVQQEKVVLAEESGPLLRHVLGIDMPRAHARRLFTRLGNQEFQEALTMVHAKTSGTKEERIERLLLHMVQPRVILRQTAHSTLKELCREGDLGVSGTKDELVDRIVQHFASGADERPVEAPPPPVVEPRVLDEARFGLLFSRLRGQELGDILRAFPELRQSGTKEARVEALWSAQRSEETLLGTLMNRDLEAILARLGERAHGSKAERIGRLVHHFAALDLATLKQEERSDSGAEPPPVAQAPIPEAAELATAADRDVGPPSGGQSATRRVADGTGAESSAS